jgi:hypothetical protein
MVTKLPIKIAYAQCDLTGVVVLYGTTGITIPAADSVAAIADGIAVSTFLQAELDPTTRDVTITGEISSASPSPSPPSSLPPS